MKKLKLNKKKLKNLSLDSRVIPTGLTRKVVGGGGGAAPTSIRPTITEQGK